MNRLKELLTWVGQHSQIERFIYKDEVRTVNQAMEVTGFDKTKIIKTVIMQHKKNHQLVGLIIPAGTKVDKRSIEEGVGPKKWIMVPYEEVEEKIGFPAGGIPPVLLSNYLNKLYVDPRVLKKDFVIGGGGDSYSLLKLPPNLILQDGAIEKVVCFG